LFEIIITNLSSALIPCNGSRRYRFSTQTRFFDYIKNCVKPPEFFQGGVNEHLRQSRVNHVASDHFRTGQTFCQVIKLLPISGR
jgi:hypothetical protein